LSSWNASLANVSRCELHGRNIACNDSTTLFFSPLTSRSLKNSTTIQNILTLGAQNILVAIGITTKQQRWNPTTFLFQMLRVLSKGSWLPPIFGHLKKNIFLTTNKTKIGRVFCADENDQS